MATTYHSDIQKLYVAYFNRPADVDGLNYWEGVVEAAGGKTDAVSAEFAKSAEYKAAFAGLTPSAVVTQVYKNLFGTSPDLAGLNYWATLLADGKITIDNVVTQIAGGALGADKTTIDNKVKAAVAFTNELDTPAEITAYSKPGAAAAAKAFISSISTDATLTAALTPATLKATVAAALEAANVGQTFNLTANQDALVGTDANDTFKGYIFNNSNTLQSGDRIDGGAGIDRLEADLGNSSSFAITPETTGIEIAAFRAQAIPGDTGDNNIAGEPSQIDAQRMVGVTQWESNNSRADLVIEDVRILDSQITKDITIAMVETDPGHVDFGVYFDQYSLRSQTNSTNVLRLQLLDTRSKAAGLDPLKESPYNGFAFYYNGVLTTVQDAAIDAATTYDQLLAAITAAVAKAGLTNITVTKGADFTVSDTLGNPVVGTEIVLTSTAGTINATGTGAGWLAAGAVPPSSGLHTNMSSTGSTAKELVTSKIIVDDVGRGSMGGDLVVGGLSTGDTSTSKGVERFEIEVRDNSKLQVVSSTNNSLREVTIKNGVTTSQSSAYVTVNKDKGDLTIAGRDGAATGKNAALPGTADAHASGYGLTDVRLVDATAMTGNLTLNAGITEASIAKYLNLKDTAVDATADNVKVDYLGGAGDDNISLTIDGGVAASNSTIKVGREDFSFNVNGGAGNDVITVKVVDGLAGNTQNWYTNQQLLNNITVSGGAGDDTIKTPGAGNFIIDGGEGNDTIYTDNTGVLAATSTINEGRATFVFNAVDGDAAAAGNQFNYFDLKSQAAASVSAVNAILTVNFKGITKTVTIANSLNAMSNVTITDLHVNQAIKEAINLDPVLSKLLVAEDGPARTLVVRSLIDGVMTTADLAITIDGTDLNPAQAALTGSAAVTRFTAAGATAVVDGYVTNFAQIAGGSTAIAGVNEVQTLTFTAATVAGDAYSITLPGIATPFVVAVGAQATAADVAAAVRAALGTPTDFTIGGTGADVTITHTGTAGDLAFVAVTQSAGTPALPTVAETTPGSAAVAAVGEAVGANSTSTSDNTITGGAGNDVIVLGTTVGADAQASSNEIVKFAGSFGNDTIVNFDIAGTAGADKLDFTALGGVGSAFNTAVVAGARTITVVAETTANDTVAEVLAFYAAAGIDSATATTKVYVAYDANNIAKVYAIVDGAGTAAGNVTATLVGTIDLAGTAWSTLTGGDFV